MTNGGCSGTGTFYPLGLGDSCTNIFNIAGLKYDCAGSSVGYYLTGNCSGAATGSVPFTCNAVPSGATTFGVTYGKFFTTTLGTVQGDN